MLDKARECREERDRLTEEASAARAIAERAVSEAIAMEREALGLDALIGTLDPRGRRKS